MSAEIDMDFIAGIYSQGPIPHILYITRNRRFRGGTYGGKLPTEVATNTKVNQCLSAVW